MAGDNTKMFTFRAPDWLVSRIRRASKECGYTNASDYLRDAANEATASSLKLKPRKIEKTDKRDPMRRYES